MKIVYTYYLLTCVALCSIFSSCNNETDIYMENPDKRIQTKMQEYTDILTGASRWMDCRNKYPIRRYSHLMDAIHCRQSSIYDVRLCRILPRLESKSV